MAALPVISNREAVKVFESLGWKMARQRGSHMILVRPVISKRCRFPIIAKSPKKRSEA